MLQVVRGGVSTSLNLMTFGLITLTEDLFYISKVLQNNQIQASHCETRHKLTP